ncbi:MAG: ATP-binding cassette domain-containing protein [Spirochaetia bacterium]
MVSIVGLEDVRKVYSLGETQARATNGVAFSIERGEFISIAGPSGSGESTILNIVGCTDTPTEGIVHLGGGPAGSLTDRRINPLRRRFIGFIFGSFNPAPVLNVFKNIEFPLLLVCAVTENRRTVISGVEA